MIEVHKLNFLVLEDLECCLFSCIYAYIHMLWFGFDKYRFLLQYLWVFSNKRIYVKCLPVRDIIKIIHSKVNKFLSIFLYEY